MSPDEAAEFLRKRLHDVLRSVPVIRVTTETKAELKTADGGQRVLAWVRDSEPGVVSLAVPADRAKLSPREARELAKFLEEQADKESDRLAGVRTFGRVHPWER